MDPITIGLLAVAAAGAIGTFVFNVIGNSQQHDYQQAQLDIQENSESDRIQDQYYDTEATITSVEDKVIDAFTNIKILVNNLDVIKRNEEIQVGQLLTADKKQQGMIFSSGYSNGFLMSETAEIIKDRNTEQIKADIENVKWNASIQEDAQKIKIGEFQSFIEKYYGKDEFSALLQGVGDINNDNVLDVYDLVGYDVSNLDLTNAGGYLGELYDRLKQLNTQLGKDTSANSSNAPITNVSGMDKTKYHTEKLPNGAVVQAMNTPANFIDMVTRPVADFIDSIGQWTGWW